MITIRNKKIEFSMFTIAGARTYITNVNKLTEKEAALDAKTLPLDEKMKNRAYLIKNFLTSVLGNDFFTDLETTGDVDDLTKLYAEFMQELDRQCEEHAALVMESAAIAQKVGASAVEFLESFTPSEKW